MPYKTVLKFCLLLVPVAAAAVVLIFYLLLPPMAETLVMRHIEENEAFSGLEFDIARIGLSGIYIRDIKKGDEVQADSLFIGYSLKSLLEKRVNRIAISGLRLDIDFHETGERPARPNELDVRTLLEPVLPYTGKVDTIAVTSSALNFSQPGRNLHIPLQARVDLDRSGQKISLSGHAFLFSQKVDIKAVADFTGNMETVSVLAEDFMLGHLSPFISRIAPQFSFSGETDIRVVHQAGEDIQVSLSHVQVEKPVRVSIENMQTRVFGKKGKIGFEGGFAAKTNRTSPLAVTMKGEYVPADGNRFSIYAENQGNNDLSAVYNGRRVEIENPMFSVQIDGTSSELMSQVSAGCSRVNLPFDGIELSGVKVHVPLRFPVNKGMKTGSFAVSECMLPGGVSVKAGGSVRQTRTGVDIKGNIGLTDVPGIECGFSGTAGMDESGTKNLSIAFAAKETKIDEKVLRPLMEGGPDGLTFEAFVSANGKIRYADRNMESDLTVDIRDGQLNFKENGLEMQNIKTTVRLDDLFGEVKSRPAQTVQIEKILMKKLVFANARVGYTIESPGSLLVENASFNWCGGNVSAESFRIIPGKKSYTLVLYCDRIRLADLLETVADFEATGEGTLSGRVPVRFDRGDISFQDAFLFTAPGSGGNIRLKNSAIITKGIPEGTSRYTQMELAREALKNYEYKWAKMLFNTKGEKLHVKLGFDGKPADVLPFEYNRELGRFTRVDASSRGSRFQGIKIDVNLTLPFNQVLKYGKELDKLF